VIFTSFGVITDGLGSEVGHDDDTGDADAPGVDVGGGAEG
jgi:hypothetical protein